MADLTTNPSVVRELIVSYQQTLVVAAGAQGWRPVADWCRVRRQPAQVLTAWNPGFTRPTLAENLTNNAALAERLAVELASRSTPFEIWPADGRAVPGSGERQIAPFHESGFCIWGASVAAVRSIAEEFGQFAIFAFDAAGRRSLVPCRDLAALLAGSGIDPNGEEPVVDPLYLIAVIRPKPDERERAAQALASLQVATRAEAGCELYDLVCDSEASDTWLMIEKWSSREHWNAHMATEHVAAIGRLESELMREPTELRFYEQRS